MVKTGIKKVLSLILKSVLKIAIGNLPVSDLMQVVISIHHKLSEFKESFFGTKKENLKK